MPLGRPIRLIRLATEIKANPKTTPQALSRNLGISTSQFYEDKGALKRLGFDFRFSRADNGFRVTTDAFLPTLAMADLLEPSASSSAASVLTPAARTARRCGGHARAQERPGSGSVRARVMKWGEADAVVKRARVVATVLRSGSSLPDHESAQRAEE